MVDAGKDNTPVTGRAKPEVVAVGKHDIIVGGRWNNEAMAEWLLKNGIEKWQEIGKLARVGCGSNTIGTKKRVRSRLSPLFRLFLEKYGFFLAIQYAGSHHSATKVKIADLTCEADVANVQARLDRMIQSKAVTQERYEHFVAILRAKQEAAHDG
jgi:hypothetical protein